MNEANDAIYSRPVAREKMPAARAQAWRAAIEPYVWPRPGAAILDLGSGSGQFCGLLAESFAARVIGVDRSRRALFAARRDECPEGVDYLVAGAEKLPFSVGVFDAAWLSHVFHHLEDRRAVLRELRRVVRTAGRVLVRGTFHEDSGGAQPTSPRLPTLAAAIGEFTSERFRFEAARRVKRRAGVDLLVFQATV